MKIFRRDEIFGWVAIGDRNPTSLLNNNVTELIKLAYTLHMDVTVNEIRQIIGTTPHPDPTLGSKYIWEEEIDVPS